jgi:hypothetical protein
MGGTSTNSQTQSSTTNPWAPAQPALTGILGQLNGQLSNTGLTGAETGALNSLSANGQNQNAGQIGSLATNLLNGGGANNQAGMINNAYQTYQQQTNPLASNTNYDPMQTPGLAQQLQTIQSDVGNSINGQFAAAGRDFSGANQQAYGRGVTQAMAPVITNQYNQNVANQQGAAQNLYNAGNTTGGLLSGMNQLSNANKVQGVQTSNDALTAQNSGANATLQAEAARRGIPVQALGLLAQIGIPIAGLGGQSTGQSNGTSTMSGAQQFGQIAGGIGSIGKIFSDRRLKEDIEQVGTLFDGTPVYRYRYINTPAFQIGLMAQDVEKVTPEAVGEFGGFKTVDYKLATDKALEAA